MFTNTFKIEVKLDRGASSNNVLDTYTVLVPLSEMAIAARKPCIASRNVVTNVRSGTWRIRAGSSATTIAAAPPVRPWDEAAATSAAIASAAPGFGYSNAELSERLAQLHGVWPDLRPALHRKADAQHGLLAIRDHLILLAHRSNWIDMATRGELHYEPLQEELALMQCLSALGRHLATTTEGRDLHRRSEVALQQAFDRWRSKRRSAEAGKHCNRTYFQCYVDYLFRRPCAAFTFTRL